MKQGPLAPGGLCCPAHRRYYDPLRLPLGRQPLPGVTGYRTACFSSPAATRPRRASPVPRTAVRPFHAHLRRRVHRCPLLEPRHLPWPSPSRNGLGSPRPACGGWHFDDACSGFAARCGPASCSTPLRTRHLGRARGLPYQGPRRLPGPDSHRLVVLSLSFGYVTTTSLSSWRPHCGAHSAESAS